MAAMDTRRLLHTALPYLLLALAFAAVAARMLTSKEEKTPPEVKLLWMR